MEKNYSEVPALQNRWIKIRSANLYDTLDSMGYPNQCINLNIKPLAVGARIAGQAVTMRGRRAPFTEDELENNPDLNPGFEIVQKFAYPGCVVVVESGGEPISGKFGEMTSWALKQNGATGIVVDGYIRDYEGLMEIPDYTVCSLGTAPIESKHRWSLCEFNGTISLPGTLSSGVRIDNGDWIVGDSDGIIVVPKKIMIDALILAEDIESREDGMRTDMRAGMSFEDAFKKWGRA
ncbi:MAG: hypothetical protein R3Y36_01920 [Spirochaetales bacterium]